MSIDVGKAIGYLDLDTSGFSSGFGRALNDLKVFEDKTATFGDKLAGLGSSFTSAGSTLTKTVTLPIAGIGAAAVKTSADFDSAMSEVKAISGATGEDFDLLRDKAKEMGAKTKFSASESAEAMKYMAMAGWKTEDMLSGIEGIMNLAAASGENLGSVSDIVTDALTAFGLSAKDSAHFSDVLAAASNNANTNVSMLGESFKYVAPVAGSLGFSVEDTSVALGLMANSGIKASAAGTSLRTILTNLVKPTSEMQTAMDELGLSITDDEGNMKSLNEIMRDLRSGFDSLSESEQANVAASLAGKEGMSGLLAIVNTSEDDFNNLSEAIGSADGTAQTMSDTMLNNLGGQLTILKSSLEGLAISIGDILMPVVQKITEKVQKIVDYLNNLDDEEKEQIVQIAAIVAAIGPVLLILGNLFKSISNISSAVSGVVKAFGLLGSALPTVAIVAGVAAIAAAFVTLWNTNEEFRNNITETWENIKQKFNDFGQGIVDRLNEMGFDFEDFGEVIKAAWQGICDFLAPIFEGAFKLVEDVLGTALDVLTGLFDVFSGIFTGDWKRVWEGIKEIFSGVWNGIKKVFTTITDTIKKLLGDWLDKTKQKWEERWNKIKTFFSDAWTNMKTSVTNKAKEIGDKISGFVSDIKDWFSDLPGNLLQIGKDLVTGLWDGIKSSINWINEKITNFGNTILNGFKSVFGIHSPSKEMKSQGSFLMQGLAKGIESSVGVVKSQIASVADTINATLDEAFDTARTIRVDTDFTANDAKSAVKMVNISGSGTAVAPPSQTANTYNFYSPQAVTPTKAAKLLRQTAQQMSLGFT